MFEGSPDIDGNEVESGGADNEGDDEDGDDDDDSDDDDDDEGSVDGGNDGMDWAQEMSRFSEQEPGHVVLPQSTPWNPLRHKHLPATQRPLLRQFRGHFDVVEFF